MRNNHGPMYCALLYLLLIFTVNMGVSLGVSAEHDRLMQGIEHSDEAATVTQSYTNLGEALHNWLENNDAADVVVKAEQLAGAAKSAVIYLMLSSIASLFTTLALLFPKYVMDWLEKCVELPEIDFDSVRVFQYLTIACNLSAFVWTLNGALDIFKYL